jgi:hypothetical protein
VEQLYHSGISSVKRLRVKVKWPRVTFVVANSFRFRTLANGAPYARMETSKRFLLLLLCLVAGLALAERGVSIDSWLVGGGESTPIWAGYLSLVGALRDT